MFWTRVTPLAHTIRAFSLIPTTRKIMVGIVNNSSMHPQRQHAPAQPIAVDRKLLQSWCREYMPILILRFVLIPMKIRAPLRLGRCLPTVQWSRRRNHIGKRSLFREVSNECRNYRNVMLTLGRWWSTRMMEIERAVEITILNQLRMASSHSFETIYRS